MRPVVIAFIRLMNPWLTVCSCTVLRLLKLVRSTLRCMDCSYESISRAENFDTYAHGHHGHVSVTIHEPEWKFALDPLQCIISMLHPRGKMCKSHSWFNSNCKMALAWAFFELNTRASAPVRIHSICGSLLCSEQCGTANFQQSGGRWQNSHSILWSIDSQISVKLSIVTFELKYVYSSTLVTHPTKLFMNVKWSTWDFVQNCSKRSNWPIVLFSLFLYVQFTS